jgi:hypothetical protein
MKSLFHAGCVLAALSSPAFAAEPPDLETLAIRLQQLEADLQAARAEIEQLKAQAALSPPAPPPPPPPATAGGSDPNAFNPALSVILNGEFSNHSADGENEGFSLGESELALSSNIDDKFYGQLTLAVENEDGADELGVEEAYIDSTALPGGFTVRAGRFFSNIGYLNNHHAHTDNFPDRPLPYELFLDGQYGDDGVQVRWLAPTDLYLELGGELLRGDSADGRGAHTLFAHAGGDVGIANAWLAGVSWLHSDADEGRDRDLYLADFTWKWAPDGNLRDGGVQLRSEWFREDGEQERSGAYAEAVYRINRRWETGYRYDRVWNAADGYEPTRHGAVLAWHNSEFSLLRLLLGRDRFESGSDDNVLLLQYQAAFGAHGAHKF